MFQSSNPALRKLEGVPAVASEPMTAEGTAGKTGICLLVLWLSASYTWAQVFSGVNPMPLATLGLVGGFITAMVTVFKMRWAPVTALLYAAFEGLAVGGVSGLLEVRFPGIAIQAVSLTFAVLVSMILLYRARVFKVTPKFTLGVMAAGGAVALIYFIGIVMQLFGARIPFIHESGPVGIIFSGVVIVIASFFLVLDFDVIEKGAQAQAPKYMEWYCAFSLMVTLIWLYFEILRLLAKLRGDRR